MLEAIFQEGILSLTLAGLTQWDYGQKLTIKGLTVSSALEVHFSNNAEKEAIVMSATKSGSDIITEIPNVLLEKDKDITAWVYTDDGQSGETIRTIVLKVTPRIKPADYISENNAGKVIDYVAKAEEYASSAQESAEIAQDNAEKVQANTDLVQDILANVPDFDSYEKLAEHNKLLYDGLYVKGETYSGIASNKGIKLHKVVGKTEQGTTKGYQLFDASKISTTSKGGATVTNNGDGSFTVSGSGNLSATFSSIYSYTKETYPFLKPGMLYASVKEKTVPSFAFRAKDENQDIVFTLYLNDENNKSVELTQDMINKIKTIEILFYAYKSAGSEIPIVSGNVKPMVYQDGDGTWEQFTGGKPGPNPDGAMPIKNVEISKIISHGRQLFDASKLPTKSQGGATVTNNNDGSFTISGSGSLSTNFIISKTYTYEETIQLIKVGTLYCKVNDVDVCPYLECGLIDSNGSWVKSITKSGQIEITEDDLSPDNSNRLMVRFYGKFGVTIKSGTIKPMLYQDGDGTWEPFKHATVETSLILADDEVYEECQPILRRRKKVVLDGSSDENWELESSSSVYRFYIRINDSLSNPTDRVPVVCNRGVFNSSNNNIGTTFIKSNLFYFIPNQDITTVELFKEWLTTHNLEVEYPLNSPTTEEFKVPTIPSYYPFTNVSTDNDLTTDMQWKILADCDNSLKQEELEKRIEALEHAMLER